MTQIQTLLPLLLIIAYDYDEISNLIYSKLCFSNKKIVIVHFLS